MKRFEDVLRILSSILLGSVIRDFDKLTKHLGIVGQALPSDAYKWLVSDGAAFVLIGVFIRNIHASARFDSFTETKKYTASFEQTLSGRFFAFLLTIAALVCGPFFAGHELVNHMDAGISAGKLGLVLFVPFAAYAIWDVLLWCSDEDPDTAVTPCIHNIADHWVRIDACALLLIMAFVLYSLHLRGVHAMDSRPYRVPPDLATVAFLATAVFMVVADYRVNSNLYFPRPLRIPATPLSAIT